MKVTIAGAGNVGTQLAVHCAEHGCEVTLFTSKADRIHHLLQILDENGQITHQGVICEATYDAKKAFSGADVVLVTVPAMLMKKYADIILPYARHGILIGLVPGTGGGECAFRFCMEKGAVVFGLQRVPSVARLAEVGKAVRAVGYRSELFAAALPCSQTQRCCTVTENLIGIKTSPLPNYLNVTLTPSNPVLHTARLFCLYSDYRPGLVYRSVPLFYEDWDLRSSELMLQCDDEVQAMCKSLKQFDLSCVHSLRDHYASYTAEAITRKISGIAGFKGLTSPAIQVEGGYVPDFRSRYFVADFSFGLTLLVQIADFLNIEAPCMKMILKWYRGLDISREEFRFGDYGINSYSEFESFYSE